MFLAMNSEQLVHNIQRFTHKSLSARRSFSDRLLPYNTYDVYAVNDVTTLKRRRYTSSGELYLTILLTNSYSFRSLLLLVVHQQRHLSCRNNVSAIVISFVTCSDIGNCWLNDEQ